jgi:hypothetical protein
MDSKLIDKVCSQVYKKFPEVKGKKPKIREYTSSQHLFIFSAKVTTSDGRSMPRTIRVIVNDDGKIGKMTTSR